MLNKDIPNTKYQIPNTSPGFTILEVTVVIFIIVLGLVGVLSLVNQNIQVEYINKNMIVASQLAQEGLELVRNKRDINWLKKEDWEHSATTGSNFDIIQEVKSKSYIIDYTGTINDATDINDVRAKLYLDGNGFYTTAVVGSPTIFSRLITVGDESAASTSVTCLVQWRKGTNAYNFSAQTVLYNWK